MGGRHETAPRGMGGAREKAPRGTRGTWEGLGADGAARAPSAVAGRRQPQ